MNLIQIETLLFPILFINLMLSAIQTLKTNNYGSKRNY